MRPKIEISSLVPGGLVVESTTQEGNAIVITARAADRAAACPLCGTMARRVHSRYLRSVSDLPCAGRRIRLRFEARRLRCEAAHCRRPIFAERFRDGLVRVHARRTARLDIVVHHLGLALSVRPGAALARRLMLPVSNDTLLRTVRRRSRRPFEPPTAIGIDDWAWRRNHRYGSIICDLERQRIVALLPDREMATVEAWLAEHREIRVVSRDRSGGYGEAAAKALPGAVQVADRWKGRTPNLQHYSSGIDAARSL